MHQQRSNKSFKSKPLRRAAALVARWPGAFTEADEVFLAGAVELPRPLWDSGSTV
jgi:hypothetical protein